MTGVSLTLSPDYWKTFSLNTKDIESISTLLFENEVPLTEAELVPILVEERIREERKSQLEKRKSDGKVYLPKDEYKVGDRLVFPALNWKKGKVSGLRPGVNPTQGTFDVIEVEFEGENPRSFAAGLEEHKLNDPVEPAEDDELLNPTNILAAHGEELEEKLTKGLEADEGLVKVAGRWFPRALLVDVNVGHLNLAEAVLDEAGGKPLPTKALIEQLDLGGNVNPKLIEFSMNFALQEDGRFDEVGPTGEVLWFLKRLEPEDVRQIPASLRYTDIPYDRSAMTEEMLALESELDDELSEAEEPEDASDEVVISLNYPHWRAGTLPISSRMRKLFPSAYYTPRVRFTLVDGATREEMPAWVVRQHGYVVGLSDFYEKYGVIPGSLLVISKGKKPGQVVVTAKTHRPNKDWVRTVLVGSDGGVVFAMLKQNITSEFNERMVMVVPDVPGVDEASKQVAKKHLGFEQLVTNTLKELVKMNVQGHAHAQEIYSALNIIRRCPPGPLFTYLAGDKKFTNVGDLHFRLADAEGDDE
jgi:hypothetical protein